MVEKDSRSRNLHFFRLLLPGFSKNLAIPTACAKRIVKEKCNMTTATITSPNGESWHVDVCKSSMQSRMHFDGERWLKFVHAHNLGLGYFLVFSYKGNMMFSFRAYDLSSCEIASYASINGDVKGDEKNKGIVSEGKTTGTEKKISNVKTEDPDDSDECTTVKKRKTSESKFKNLEISESTANKIRRIISPHHERITRYSLSKKACFEATIKPGNVCQRPYMNIPWKFCESYGLTNHRELILMDPEDRRWFVCLNHRRILLGNSRNRSHMGRGWDHFAVANQMKVGDKCVFKLVPRKNCDVVILKVQVEMETI